MAQEGQAPGYELTTVVTTTQTTSGTSSTMGKLIAAQIKG
jgi:hypothetical protein